MPLTVGQDSYITESQASNMLSYLIPGKSVPSVAWKASTPNDREACIRMAMGKIESKKYSGRKQSPDQALSFPRHTQDTVPEAVKQAVVLEAASLCATMSNDEFMRAQAMQAQGIASYSVEAFSISFESTAKSARDDLCPEAQRLVKPYLLGVARID